MVREYQHGTPTKVAEVRKGDTVVVIAGKDAGKRGTVEKVISRTAAPTAARSSYRRGTNSSGTAVVVEGLNLAKRHTKQTGTMMQAGIIDKVMPIHVSNVQLVDPKGGKPTRVKIVRKDGARTRVAVKSGQEIK